MGQKVGFVGLGAMGGGMALALQKRGLDVCGYDVSLTSYQQADSLEEPHLLELCSSSVSSTPTCQLLAPEQSHMLPHRVTRPLSLAGGPSYVPSTDSFPMAYHGVPWCTMVYHGCTTGIPWCTMVYHGVPTTPRLVHPAGLGFLSALYMSPFRPPRLHAASSGMLGAR